MNILSLNIQQRFLSEKSSGIEHSNYYNHNNGGDADADEHIYLFKRYPSKSLIKLLNGICGHMVLSFGFLLLIVFIHQ